VNEHRAENRRERRAAMTWFFYLRTSFAAERYPSFAYAWV
jgi:hypothetical protein